MKHAWISKHRDSFPVSLWCEVLNVSKSGYYASVDRPLSLRTNRHVRIRAAVAQVHARSHAIYGSLKISQVLRQEDQLESACRNTVAAAMRELGLQSRTTKAFTPTTTQADPAKQPAPNTLRRNFIAPRRNRNAVRKANNINWTDASEVTSWGGKTKVRFSADNRLRIGEFKWERIKVWEDKLSGVGTDGKFGLDLFDDRIVEIDFDRRCIIIYDTIPAKAAKYQHLKLECAPGELFVEGNCMFKGASEPNRFLIHTGYSGGILLDDDFVKKTGIDGQIEINEESSLKDSFGNMIKVKKATLPALTLGDISMEQVPVGFFSGAIGRQKKSVMGMAVLKRLNLIFDVSNESLYVSRRQKPCVDCPSAQ